MISVLCVFRLNMRVARLLETTRWGQNPLLEVALVAIVTNLIRFPFVLLRGSTYHFLSVCFDLTCQLDHCFV